MKRVLKLFGIIAILVFAVLGITSCDPDDEMMSIIIVNNSTVHTITALQHGKMVAGKFDVNRVYPINIEPGGEDNLSIGLVSWKTFGVTITEEGILREPFATASLGASVTLRDGDTIIITLGSNDNFTVKKQ
jgi:hypothetical protein